MKKALLSKLTESLTSVLPVFAIVLVLSFTPLAPLSWQERVLNRARIPYELKDQIYRILSSGKSLSAVCSTLQAMNVSADLLAALMEPVDGSD